MLLVGTAHERDLHDTGRGHPERPRRVGAALAGIGDAGLAEAVRPVAVRAATVDELALVHPRPYVDALERFCAAGGGALDPDTVAVQGSWTTALLAAGGGLCAIEALERGEGDAAFLALRPPGHHALADRAMGFCLFNNVAVAAAALAERGERVAIIDWDVHHGNGTQDIFWDDPRVLYVSTHQSPLYPGTGRLAETGGLRAPELTVNLPLPPGATGDVLLRAFDEVVAPAVEGFAPTWLFVSAGFDGHRADPLAELRLTAGDYADLSARVAAMAPGRGRLVLFLEGGYDLDALRSSVGATLAAVVGERFRPEPASSGGPGMAVVDQALHRRATT